MSLGKIATILRTAGESLHRQFGDDAADILYEAIADAEAEVDRFFADPTADAEEIEPDAPE